MDLIIRKKVGSFLPMYRLPGLSLVEVQVVEGDDGMLDLRISNCNPTKLNPDVSISDLRFILEWASEP